MRAYRQRLREKQTIKTNQTILKTPLNVSGNNDSEQSCNRPTMSIDSSSISKCF